MGQSSAVKSSYSLKELASAKKSNDMTGTRHNPLAQTQGVSVKPGHLD